MPELTDPSIAMRSFQQELSKGLFHLKRGRVDTSIHYYLDLAEGMPRFTYVQLEGKTVTAFATFSPNGTFEGHPNIAAGYAVPETYRDQGRAKAIFLAGIVEMQNGFKGQPPFYVEAVVSVNNPASLKVTKAVLGGTPEAFNDNRSGESVLRYAKLFQTVS